MSAELTQLRQDELFLRKAFHRSLLPCILSILSGNINILVDGILVGQRIGTDGLSAISLCVPVYLMLCVIGSFIVSGTAIQASKAIGRQDGAMGQRLYATSVWMCVAASAFVTVIGLALCHPLSVMLCGDESGLIPLVYGYASVTIIGALPKILVYVPFWFLRMDGRASLVTWMMLVMGGGNAILDYIFLYPLGMGIEGAAWASVISTALACIIGFVWLSDRRSGFHLGRAMIRQAEEWKAIAIDGSPSALNNLFQTLRLLVVNAMLMDAGGSALVAVFTAVNCISAFSLAVTDGVTQAASPMLGIYSGERDNGSTVLLVRREWRTGVICSAIFSVAIIALSDVISSLYGLDVSLYPAMACLSLGMFPGLLCSILSVHYNISGHAGLANLIIFSRTFLMAGLSLLAALRLGLSPWLFLFLSEVLTVIIWVIVSGIYHRLHPICTRFLLLDRSLEREGSVLNFSVAGSVEEICTTSERLSGFCTEIGMGDRESMSLGLAVEEIMTLIVGMNDGVPVRFDVRMFSVHDVIGLRVRYGGIEFNPFSPDHGKEDDLYLGAELISGIAEHVLYQRTFGVNTVQILL